MIFLNIVCAYLPFENEHEINVANNLSLMSRQIF